MAEDAPDKIKRAPFPTEIEAFKDDERVSYDQVTQSHKLEDEAGEEWEWLPKPAKWVPVVCFPSICPSNIDRLWPCTLPAAYGLDQNT